MSEAPVETPPVETPPVETPPVETPPAANWRDSLPEEIRADATLARYADVNALAAAHIEAHKVAKSKIVLPGDGADEAAMGQFYDAIGRPKSPDDYDVPMPELSFAEDATDEVKAEALAALKAEYQPFRELAHKVGLRPEQAAALAQFELDRQKAYLAKGEEEIGALKKEMGEEAYNEKLDAAKAIFLHLGFPEEFADELDRKVGSAALVKGFMKLAGVAGEHSRVDGDGGNLFEGDANAEVQLKKKQADPTWRQKLESGDQQVNAEYQRLLAAAKKQAGGGR